MQKWLPWWLTQWFSSLIISCMSLAYNAARRNHSLQGTVLWRSKQEQTLYTHCLVYAGNCVRYMCRQQERVSQRTSKLVKGWLHSVSQKLWVRMFACVHSPSDMPAHPPPQYVLGKGGAISAFHEQKDSELCLAQSYMRFQGVGTRGTPSQHLLALWKMVKVSD